MKSYIIKKKIPRFVRNDDSTDESTEVGIGGEVADSDLPSSLESACHSERSEESLIYSDNKTSEISDSKTKRIILIIICLATFQTPFMGSALNLALPSIAKSFSLDAVAQSWIVSIYLLSSAIFAIPFAKLGDMLGRKKVFTWGVFMLLFASCGCVISPSFLWFVAFRFLQGLGSAMIFGTGMPVLISVFSPKERGKVLGINTSVVYFSAAAGPFLGGMLTEHFGWKSIFVLNIIVGVLILFGVFSRMRAMEWIESKKGKFDLIGVLIYALGLSSLIYGFSRLPHIYGFYLTATGLILLCLFGVYENKYKFPIFNVKLFVKNKVFRLSSFAALINYAATFGIGYMLSLYLQHIKGYSAQIAGTILIIQPVTQGIFSMWSGRLSDKINAAKLATSGMALIVVALLLMLLLNENTPLLFLVFGLIVLGTGFAFFSSPNMNVIMISVDKQYFGMASATTGTMRLVGQSFSMGIVAMITSLIVGKVKITSEVHVNLMESIHSTFIVFAILCSIGVYFSLSRTK